MDTQSFRKSLVEEFNSILKEENFQEILKQLSFINEYIEIRYFEYNDFSDREAETNLGYFYNNEFVESPEELHILYTNKIKYNLEINQKIKYLESIMELVYSFALKKRFIKVINILNEATGTLMEEFIAIYPKEFPDLGGYYGMNLYLCNKNILKILFDEEQNIDEWIAEYRENNFKEYFEHLKVGNIETPFLFNILNYEKLDSQTKKFIEVGNTFFTIFFVNDKKEDLYDYSGILLPFIKAVENETTQLIAIYQTLIYKNSQIILDEIKKRIEGFKNKSLKKKYEDLFKFATKLVENYPHKIDRMRSLWDLFIFIKYFILETNDENLRELKDIFPKNLKVNINKSKLIINSLKNLAEKRNSFIHADTIQSKQDFELTLVNLKLVLELLVQIKMLKDESN